MGCVTVSETVEKHQLKYEKVAIMGQKKEVYIKGFHSTQPNSNVTFADLMLVYFFFNRPQ